MSRFTRLLATAGTSALLLTAVGAPASAIPEEPRPLPGATITVVQGIPGNVDICVGGKEIASDVPFGQWATRADVEPRTYKVRVFRPDPRTCAGDKIMGRKVELWPGRDMSMVLKLGRPRVVMFENGEFGPDVADGPGSYVPVALRHAARARDVEMQFGYSMPVPPEIFIADEPGMEPWNAGDEAFIGMPTEIRLMVGARRDGERLVRPKPVRLIAGKMHEVYLVGSNKATYRWVVVRRPMGFFPI